MFLAIKYLLLHLAVVIISQTSGANIDEELGKLKQKISAKFNSLQPEIHAKFVNDDLRQSVETFRKTFLHLGETMAAGYEDALLYPEIDMRDELETLLKAFFATNEKIEPEMTFLASTERIIQDILRYFQRSLGWLDFIFKSTLMKPVFETFGMTKFSAMLKVCAMFENMIKMMEVGRKQMQKHLGADGIEKLELYAMNRYLLDVIDSAMNLHFAIYHNYRKNIKNINDEKLDDDFVPIRMMYKQLEYDLRFLLNKFQSSARPIDDEIAQKLAIGENTILERFLETSSKIGTEKNSKNDDIGDVEKEFKNVHLKVPSMNDGIERIKEWKGEVLVYVGQVLKAYFAEEEEYLEKKHHILDAAGSSGTVDHVGGISSKLLKEKTDSKDWEQELLRYTNEAPLLRENGEEEQQTSKYPPEFIGLFLQRGGRKKQMGLNLQAMLIMHIGQIQDEFKALEGKGKKTRKDNRKIKKYKEHRAFIEHMAGMRMLISNALVLHVSMQHWFSEKSKMNAEKMQKCFNALQDMLKAYPGIKKAIDKSAAVELAKGNRGVFGKNNDANENHSREEIEHESHLLATIGKVLGFYYNEVGEANALFSGGASSSSSSQSSNVVAA